MSIVHLPDNSLEIIADNHDLVKLIQQHMGFEVAQVVEELCKSADREKIRAEGDLISYECQLEENNDAFMELQRLLYKVEKELQAKRVNRNNIQNLVDRMELEIANQM
ncbi:hypothetical protein [Paenibacillus tianjinensis]|uniref:MerR, DNA binding n=1 Tax=Paenibacillus tianjinensis TaxID=2810347 RepID=A0ABX7L5M7_9BACL|nr:hypothetical protein [Paenibacillus tianjinensis]QSF43410.1 hypothetical protein JRJ22_19285 [Paenibacillus tianjinensis]